MGGNFDATTTFGKKDRPDASITVIELARVSVNSLGNPGVRRPDCVAVMINEDGPNTTLDVAPTNAAAIVFEDPGTLDSFVRSLLRLRKKVWGKA